jgi:hypothetical protein
LSLSAALTFLFWVSPLVTLGLQKGQDWWVNMLWQKPKLSLRQTMPSYPELMPPEHPGIMITIIDQDHLITHASCSCPKLLPHFNLKFISLPQRWSCGHWVPLFSWHSCIWLNLLSLPFTSVCLFDEHRGLGGQI